VSNCFDEATTGITTATVPPLVLQFSVSVDLLMLMLFNCPFVVFFLLLSPELQSLVTGLELGEHFGLASHVCASFLDYLLAATFFIFSFSTFAFADSFCYFFCGPHRLADACFFFSFIVSSKTIDLETNG
jgi:hypothetical protein